jgi:ubiquinone/menaquinone biosynthesis C-methylase UbiE
LNCEVFDPVQYKINTRLNWNNVAPTYHKDWANRGIGPFKSTTELVKAAEISTDDIVLDVGCGTDVVSKEISHYLGSSGIIIEIDISRVALSIAKSSINMPNRLFIEMDGENLGFPASSFSKVISQYALMFFPNPNYVLKMIKRIMKKEKEEEQSKLAIAIHGTSEGVPYFSCIMNSILKYIPDIRVKGSPSVHSLGNPDDFYNTIATAGFSDISIKKYTFYYQAGTFEEYWSDYLSSTANAIRSTLEGKGSQIVSAIKKDAQEIANQFIDDGDNNNNNNGIIQFPWDMLLATAYNKT